MRRMHTPPRGSAASYPHAQPSASSPQHGGSLSSGVSVEAHPVTEKTKRILDQMRQTLTCTICNEILRNAHSLPCQHHFCFTCVNEQAEREGSLRCPTCRNTFWRYELRVNTKINSMIENYEHLAEWIKNKAKRMGQVDSDGNIMEKRSHKDDEDDDGQEGSKENRRSRQADSKSSESKSASAAASKPSAASSSRTGTASTTPRKREMNTVDGDALNAAASLPATRISAFSVPNASAHTPVKGSLRDTIAAVGNDTLPNSSLSSLPKPSAAVPAPASTAAAGSSNTLQPPISHQKNFSKQAVTKKTPSPIPTAAPTTASTPTPIVTPTTTRTVAATPASALSANSTHVTTPAPSRPGKKPLSAHMRAVFGDDWEESDDAVDEDEVQEVSKEKFTSKRAAGGSSALGNNANSIANLPSRTILMAPALQGSKQTQPQHRPVFNNAAGAAVKPSTLKQYFTSNQPSPPTPALGRTAGPIVKTFASLEPPRVDHDGDGLMDGPVVVAPSAASASSLSPKLVESPNSAAVATGITPSALSRQISAESQPLLPIEGSLSLPRYASASPPKDTFGSPPPLELAPPINIYSPAPAIWGSVEAGDQLSESQEQQSPQRMEIDEQQQPQRRSLATDLATLHATRVIPPPTAAVVAPAAVPSAAPTSDEAAAVSRAPSAVSIQLSLPPLTETSVAMPSMNGMPARSDLAMEMDSTVAVHPSAIAPSSPESAVTAPAVPSPITPAVVPVATPPIGVAAAPTATSSVALPVAAATATEAAAIDPMQAPTLSIPIDTQTTPSPPPPPSLVTAPICIVCTSLSQEQLQQLTPKSEMGKFITDQGSKLISNWSADVTHVVCNIDPRCPPGHRLAPRSVKYMLGVLCGAWIVSWVWVVASHRAGRWIEETPYEMEGDFAKGGVSFTPRKMKERLAQNGDRLLKNIKFCIYNKLVAKTDPSERELAKLIEFGHGIQLPTVDPKSVEDTLDGGTTTISTLAQAGIRRLPSTASTIAGPIYLLVTGQAHMMYTETRMQLIGAALGMIPVAIPWLLDSISLGRILNIDPYRADLSTEEKARAKEQQEQSEANAART